MKHYHCFSNYYFGFNYCTIFLVIDSIRLWQYISYHVTPLHLEYLSIFFVEGVCIIFYYYFTRLSKRCPLDSLTIYNNYANGDRILCTAKQNAIFYRTCVWHIIIIMYIAHYLCPCLTRVFNTLCFLHHATWILTTFLRWARYFARICFQSEISAKGHKNTVLSPPSNYAYIYMVCN